MVWNLLKSCQFAPILNLCIVRVGRKNYRRAGDPNEAKIALSPAAFITGRHVRTVKTTVKLDQA